MRLKSSIISITLLILTAIFGLRLSFAESIPQPDLTPVSVQISWHHQYQFAGFYAAIARGYYQDVGLDVTVKSWHPGIDMVEEVLSGRSTFSVAYSSVLADYIKGEPIQTVMTSLQYSPMVLLSKEPINQLSQLSGKTVAHYNSLQILALLNRAKNEMNASAVEVLPTGNLKDFIEGHIDLYGAYETNEPYQLDEMGVDYHVVNPNLFGINITEDFVIVAQDYARHNPMVVEKFKEATIAGWKYAIENQQEIVDFIFDHYPLVKSRQALIYEAVGTTKYVRAGNTPIGWVEPAKILNTALELREAGLISSAEFDRFEPESLMARSVGALNLTREELLYLSENPVIKIGNDVNWEPFEFIDSQNRYRGIAADYFKLFEQRLGVVFEPVKSQNWQQVLAMAQLGEVEVLPAAVATSERQAYLDFSPPYLSFPMVLVGRQGSLFIDDFKVLEGHKVAVVKGYLSHEYLKNNYPQLELQLVDSVEEGLEAVLKGRAQFYSGNLAAINYTSRQRGLTGLTVVGQSDQRFELAIGVQKDNPILLSILQKTLNSMTEKEHNQIYQQWIDVEMVSRLDRRQLIQLGLIAGLVLLFMTLWLLTYRYQKKRMQRYIDQVHELTYASLIDAKSYQILWVSESYCRLTGYAKTELINKPFLELAGEGVSPKKLEMIAEKVLSGQRWSGDIEGCTKQAKSYWIELTLSPQQNLRGQVTKVWATRVDITDKKRIEQLSIRDDLTGLYNRRYLNVVFDREVKRIQRQGGQVCLAVFDLDFFRQVNDCYGHQFGDQVLQKIAELVVYYFNRAGDFVFRLGGEEFLVLTHTERQEEFIRHIQLFCQAVVNLAIENKHSELGKLSVSIGAGVWPAMEVTSFETVYQQIDNALYRAKSQGRNQVSLVD